MSPAYWEVQSAPKVHEGDVELDESIIAVLPSNATILSCRGHGASNWNTTARIVIDMDGKEKSYFLKLQDGPTGGEMFHGEFESMKMINDIVPDFSPKPLSWGKCKASARHFILFEYHALRKGDPPIPRFTYAISQLHTLSLNANLHGKFGFHITTYNGTLAQDNTWTDTWEEFYSRGMKRMLQIDAEARGASDEIEQLAVPLLAKVIPRLLRPLENGGREIKPVLIHGDLWLGNVSVKDGSDDPLMFDASAFWGHNEYELATMRLLENDWGEECLRKYHERIPKSAPEEDWDARNALYAIRVIIHDSALYPDSPHFRETLIEEMKKLVERFPEGYVEASG